MDTSKFTSDKEAGDGYRDYRKAAQAAFDDINAVLQPKPRINKIMATDAMAQVIVDKIGACVGVDNEGAPVWTDDRAGKLKPETIELYSFLVSPEGMAQMGMTAPEPTGDPEPELAQAATEGMAQDPSPKFAEEGQECSGWLNKTGPDPRYKKTCDACSRNEACAAQVEAKASKKTKAEPKPPKEPKAPSARGVMLDSLCENPKISKEALLAKVVAAGFKEGENFKKATLDTVYSDCQQIFARLRKFGHLAE